MDEKDVVPKHQGRGRAVQKALADGESLCQPVKRRLLCIREPDSPLPFVAKEAFEKRQVNGRGNEQNIPMPACMRVLSG